MFFSRLNLNCDTNLSIAKIDFYYFHLAKFPCNKVVILKNKEYNIIKVGFAENTASGKPA